MEQRELKIVFAVYRKMRFSRKIVLKNEFCSFFGTSGQNIDDIYKYCEEDNRLKLASRTLKWRHLCPSCPDTLGRTKSGRVRISVGSNFHTFLIIDNFVPDGYPFKTQDPFMIQDRPDVYFIGNQPEFGFDYVHDDSGSRVMVVTLPNFAQTGYFALVNLKNLSVEPVQISVV